MGPHSMNYIYFRPGLEVISSSTFLCTISILGVYMCHFCSEQCQTDHNITGELNIPYERANNETGPECRA